MGARIWANFPVTSVSKPGGTSSPAILCSAAGLAMTEGTLVLDEPGGHQRQEKPMSEHRQALERLSALLVS